MKHKLLLTLGIAALSLVGCTQDVEVIVPEPPRADGAMEIKIDGRIDQEYATRVDDGGFCDGDQVGLYGVNYTDNNATAGTLLDEGNQVDNARYTFDEETHTWSSSGNIYYKDAETNIDIYAYYPYARPESVSAYKFEVAEDQSGVNALDGFALSDFLWAKAENVTPSEAKVKLHFTHRLSSVNVNLVEGAGFAEGEFAGLKKSVLVMNTTRTAEIDLSTGVATPTGEAASEGIVTKYNAEGFRAIVVPQLVGAGKSLLSITVDGISYRFKKDVDFVYEAGKMTKFEIKINKKEHTGEYEFVLTATDIVDWVADLDTHGGEARQYYVVHLDEAGTLEAKLNEAKKDPAKIKNLKISGEINAKDFYYMRSMPMLQYVNLIETTVEPCYAFEATIQYNGEEFKCRYNWSFAEYMDCPFIAVRGVMPKTLEEAIEQLEEQYPGYEVLSGEWTNMNKTQYNANEIPAEIFNKSYYLTNITFPQTLEIIGRGAFAERTCLTGSIIFPDSIKKIGDEAFRGCSNVTYFSLPNQLETIGGRAFAGCSSWNGQLDLPSSVTTIGGSAFEYCSALTGSLVLPESLISLGGGAFCGCSGFSGGLTIPLSITSVESGTFQDCSGLNGTLVLHDGIKSLGDRAFGGCSFQGELQLPTDITKIPEWCFTSNNFSYIKEFPEGLLEIGNYAFCYNRRLMGHIKLPKSLVKLGDNAFEMCSNLEGVTIPKDLAIIRPRVFLECYGINTFICEADEPPFVQNGGLDGIPKDNFVLEVPEKSINRYQSDPNWGEFKRIGAHYDFSISRRQMRVLNAEHSREFVLRAPANYAWSVESCPEWVTINPSSGVGKTEVTVTVAEMTTADVGSFEINTGVYNNPNYETHEGRVGEIVFLLNDKDARVKMSVEQYDSDNYDGEVIVNQSATKGGGVNIVFMGDCFDARDIAMGGYLDGINEAIGYYFDIEPYKTYRDYFNVYTIVGMSNDSGMGTVNTVRDAKFGSQYTINEGVKPDETTTFEYAMKAETVNESNINKTLVVLIENTTDYGGICYMWDDGSAIACCPMSRDAYPYDFRGIVQHEAGGHGFAKLCDEYIYHNAFVQSCGCICCPHVQEFNDAKARGWYRNLEVTGDMDEVAWSHLIFHPKYSNIVDIYEGGYFHSRGVFRSEPNSCMNNNIPYYSAISRQEMVERIMRYAGEEFDINDFYANDVLDIQGNAATRSAVEESLVISSGAGKQMPPRFMGDKPQLKKNNK